MPDFKGNDAITLHPGDDSLEFSFQVTISTSATANDGKIGFGRTVSSVALTAHKDDGSDTSETGMPGAHTLLTNVITVPLSYPTGLAGTYHLRFLCTLDDASVKDLYFDRVRAVSP